MPYSIGKNIEERLGGLSMTSRGSHLVQQGRERGPFRMDGVVIELTREEVLDLSLVGLHRMLESEMVGRKDNQESGRTYTNDIRGILAEGAFCKAVGLAVTTLIEDDRKTIHELRQGDVGAYQIRTTTGMQSSERGGKRFHANRLIFREGDNPEAIYVLVIGTGAFYEIAGWLRGREIMTVRTGAQGAEHRTSAWFAWVEDLHPIRTLPGWTGEWGHKVESEEIRRICPDLVSVREEEEEEEEEEMRTLEDIWQEIRLAHVSAALVKQPAWDRRPRKGAF